MSEEDKEYYQKMALEVEEKKILKLWEEKDYEKLAGVELASLPGLHCDVIRKVEFAQKWVKEH